ncbi:gas vesicle protein GvpG [Omnitrophica bacterium]|nr:gas vesicle protein GvpG [Candidatus Omnitrophota bacterium]
MKKILLVSVLLAMTVGLSACSGAFWTGAGGGTLATGAGYEANAQIKLNQLKKDLDAGKIDQKEYDIRVDQIKKMSLTS